MNRGSCTTTLTTSTPTSSRSTAKLNQILSSLRPRTCSQSAQQLDLADIYEQWEQFTLNAYAASPTLPPDPTTSNQFVRYVTVSRKAHLARKRLLDECAVERLGARQARLDSTPPYDSAPPPDPIPARPSASPVTTLGDRASAPIELSSDEENPPTAPVPAGTPWAVVGGKKGRSYASIAKPTPPTKPIVPPTRAQAAGGFITAAQLSSMTKDQVIYSYNLRFEPKIPPPAASRRRAPSLHTLI